jgi:predicted nucleic acid-binding protein
MVTAVDSNVLIDLLGEETRFTAPSIAALDEARMRGALVICPIVASEISAHFASAMALEEILLEMGLAVSEMSLHALHLAGTAFVRYRRRSAKPKERMLADFLVGAHALCQGDGLLTRDRGYYRTYFPKLQVIDAGGH